MHSSPLASRGFSLIELMVVVAVLAILATIAAPNMADLIDRQRVVGAAEDIRGLLSLGRSEAIKQSTTVRASIVSGTGAYVGLSHGDTCDDNAADCTISLAGVPVAKVVALSAYPGVTLAQTDGAPDSIIFTSRGVPATLDDSTTISLTSARGSTLNVVVNPIGRVSICAPDTGKNAGAYASCQ